MNRYVVYTEKPEDFAAEVEVSGCFCEHENKILFLKRHSDQPQGGTWNIPAGKKEGDETPLENAVRELKEEAGIHLGQGVKEVGTLFVSIPDCNYAFHMFYQSFGEQPSITLDQVEQIEARWLTIEEALHLPLIGGGQEALQYFQTWKASLLF